MRFFFFYDRRTQFYFLRRYISSSRWILQFIVQSVKLKIVKLVFVASVLRIESKGWLAWNQDNVYERRHVYPRTVVSVSPRFLCRPTAFFDLLQPWDVRELYIRKTADFPFNSGSAHFHVSWLFDFIFYQKPLYKSLHQSFFYSFITILPSESGVTLHFI